MSRAVISLNSGSSSIKFGLFIIEGGEPFHAAGGKLEGIGTAPHLVVTQADGSLLTERRWDDGAALTHEELLEDLYQWADGHLPHHDIVAVGHRVVHGGVRFSAPVVVNDAVLKELDGLCSLAPLHQPHNLAAIRAISKMASNLPQIACFDTAFHHGIPDVATRFALPRAFMERGIRRYGFHGISYEYIARRLEQVDPALAGGRVVTAHLGNGASLCAMLAGRSVETSMGFTALDGLMMGTRSGALDPGVVLHLLRQEGLSAQQVETMLYKQSGLLGVSGVSSDMRTLHASADPHAAEAVELFCWRIARESGAMMAALGGLDGFVFTAGIGENDPLVRKQVCDRLAWTGLMLDDAANEANAAVISTPDSSITVCVIPTDEERMIALHTIAMLEEIL